MGLRILGPGPFEVDAQRRPITRIATIFPRSSTLVTLPGIHATQRNAYVDGVHADRRNRGLEPLRQKDESDLWSSAVDLIFDGTQILIRPNPKNVGLIFEADELLSELVSRRQIHFLDVRNEAVHEAIKRRGECWRITPRPRSKEQMKRLIARSRIGIGGKEIYYYNQATGTRLLTCEQFANLQSMDDAQLRQHLLEIYQYGGCVNSLGNREVDFFLADGDFRKDFQSHDFRDLETAALRDAHRALAQRFGDGVPPEARRDDLKNIEWRRRMFAALSPPEEHVVTEESRLGLSSEFYMHIEWLPGGRMEDGQLVCDPIFEEIDSQADHGDTGARFDDKARGLIFNYARDYDQLAYINVGRVVESLSYRREWSGRRNVYVVEMKQRDSEEEIVKIIRMQKWDLWKRLDEGVELLQAMIESEEYTEYILDRGLACRRLGMKLPGPMRAGKVGEIYRGTNQQYRGRRIWLPYFERDYVRGIATDKIPAYRYHDPEFAVRFAALLGQAAAPNLIVGRCTPTHRVMFDDGDEVLVEDEHRLPGELIVTHYTGAFADFTRDLCEFAPEYAVPVNSRLARVSNPTEFAESYAAAFLAAFKDIQKTYRDKRTAFDGLFQHRHETAPESLSDRWAHILTRLDETDVGKFEQQLRAHLARGPGQREGRPAQSPVP